MNIRKHGIVAACLALLAATAAITFACPFCSVESQTLSEETRGADAVVLAKLVKDAPPSSTTSDPNDPNAGMATFKIVEVIKGAESLKDTKEINVVFFGDTDREKTYLISGLGKEKVDWTTPLPLTATGVGYVKQLPTLPPTGPERLEFFQDYLENADPLLAQDAYDEFGKAPYAELHELKPNMKHDKIVKWVADPEVSPNRRRLYLTMLGVCGTSADVPLLESMIVSDFDAIKPPLVAMVETGLSMGGPAGMPIIIEAVQQEERRKKLGLDALVACYLTLRGPEGMDLIDKRFLKNPHAEYTHVYSTIMALRFHGDESTSTIPRERLLTSMRLLLDNADFSDQVILDLSRWDDWSVMDRLVGMFKTADAKSYIRQPVISYLTVASEQPGDVGKRALAAMEELEKLDPDTVKTARNLMAFGALGRARGAASTAGASSGDKTASAAEPSDQAKAAADDPKQGFAASTEDEKTDTSKIPDPAAFAQGTSAKTDAKTTSNPPTVATTLEPAKPPVENGAAKTAPVQNEPATVSNGATHKVLVAGLPLGAAVLLVGVYWMIMRSGA